MPSMGFCRISLLSVLVLISVIFHQFHSFRLGVIGPRERRQLGKRALFRRYNNFNVNGKNKTPKPDFLLRCPQVPWQQLERANYSVVWTLNQEELVRFERARSADINDSSSFVEIENELKVFTNSLNRAVKVQRWRTVSGQPSAIVATENPRWKFEFEESRQWFALRIQKVKPTMDEGTWRCQILHQDFGGDGSILRAESAKTLGGGEKPSPTHFHRRRRRMNVSSKNGNGKNGLLGRQEDELLQMALDVPPIDQAFAFSKNSGGLAVFDRVGEMSEFSYTRSENPEIEYSRQRKQPDEKDAKRVRSGLGQGFDGWSMGGDLWNNDEEYWPRSRRKKAQHWFDWNSTSSSAKVGEGKGILMITVLSLLLAF